MNGIERSTDTQFEVGKSYYCRSLCDHNTIWYYTVTRRTEKCVWISQDGVKKAKRRLITIDPYDGEEIIYPRGKYALCPSLSAQRQARPEDDPKLVDGWVGYSQNEAGEVLQQDGSYKAKD